MINFPRFKSARFPGISLVNFDIFLLGFGYCLIFETWNLVFLKIYRKSFVQRSLVSTNNIDQ